MLDKQITQSGKIFTKITNLQTWEKNPRNSTDLDHDRLRRQLAHLGQYKPLLVTQDGLLVGGNMRLMDMNWLNQNVLTYTNAKGEEISIDLRGKFDDVWITELSFAEVENTDPAVPKKYKALIDGKPQEGVFDSIEQIMIEYALSDNDAIGTYDQQKLANLITPYKELIPLPDYKLELAPHIPLETFLQEFKPAEVPQLGGNKEINKNTIKKDLNITCPKCGFHLQGNADAIEEFDNEQPQ